MKKAILYARIATPDQPHRLRMQIDEMTAFCQKNNIEVVTAFCEVAHGANFERDRFQAMLVDLEEGKLKADLVLFTTWDRFSRSLTEALEMMKRLKTLGVRMKSLQDFGSNDFEIIIKHSGRRKK